MSATFLLLKSIYILSIFYFHFPLLLTHPLALSLLLALFNSSIAFFLYCKWRHVDFRAVGKDLAASLVVGWGLVFVAGADPFNPNSLVFSLLLSSVAFNLLTIQPFKDSSLLTSFVTLNFLKLAKNPLKMTLLFASLGSLIGSFLTGLAVILDWDVEWKRFPIPNMVGCIFGEFCGIIVAKIIISITGILK